MDFNVETPRVRWEKVSLIGVGLLGGSLGMALRQGKLASEVVGYVRRRASITECKKAGAVDRATTSIKSAVSNADLVVLCTPLGQMTGLVKELLPFLRVGALITDVGSVKASLVADLENSLKGSNALFVGSHPMAGSEKTGVSAARADLYKGAVTVVTPTTNSDLEAVAKIEALWKSLGSRVLRLEPDLHDEMVSRSSHLPHLVAACLARIVLDPSRPETQSRLCASGFRDCTRVASGSPQMWADIGIANREHLDCAIEELIAELNGLRHMLSHSDSTGLKTLLESAKDRRDKWQASSAPVSSE